MTKRLVRASVRYGLRHERVRRLVAGELAATRPPVAPAPIAGPPTQAGVFVDDNGVAHPLDPTLRDKLKPGWRTYPTAGVEDLLATYAAVIVRRPLDTG